ncbi:MAG: glycosyltransferase [Pseudomonadota bacterium]
MNGKIVAVIVTYNRLEMLKVALSHTFEKGFYKVVVIDNCSNDGTQDWLEEQDEASLVVVRSPENVGGAGGFQMGFQYAVENVPEAQWLVCFDDDAHPSNDVVEKFNAMAIPRDVATMAAAVYLPDGRISEMNRPSLNPFWHVRQLIKTAFKGRQGFHIADEDYLRATAFDIDSSSFVGCFVRLDFIRNGAIGLPRGEFFIYADDIIYVLESRKAGFRHLFVPAITFVHDCQTLVNQKSVYTPLWRAYYTYRNGLEMYRVASGLFYPLVLLVKIPKFFISARHYKRQDRLRYLRITAVAIWDGLWRDYSKTHQRVVDLG